MFSLQNVTPRVYQEVIAASASKGNTLVVLPTGLGKTVISVILALHRLAKFPDSKILILAPTRPLVNQHLETFKSFVNVAESDVAVFTGMVKPEMRKQLFETAKIIFSTPQGLENDIISSKIKLDKISLIIFDEAHRATGEYSYVWVAKQYMKQSAHPLILALTASPGSDKDTITEVCDNLSIENIEYRELTSPDVKPYVQQTSIQYIDVDLPEPFKDILTLLKKSYAGKINELKSAGFFKDKNAATLHKSMLLQFVASLQKEIANQRFTPEIAIAMSLGAQALKISHAIELIESQGISNLKLYLDALFAQAAAGKTKAAVMISKDPHIRLAYVRTKELVNLEQFHPKLYKMIDIVGHTVKKNPKSKIIVFCQFRDSLKLLVEKLSEIAGVDARIFVGQAKKGDTGMSQKDQLLTLEQFRNGDFNVVCMSSVGEEGLDIPSVDLVVFYEPVPSAIRTIQRKGRTGRQDDGRVIVLCTKDTRDMAYRWVSYRKEKNMYDILKSVKEDKNVRSKVTLNDFSSAMTVSTPKIVAQKTISVTEQVVKPIIKIIADHREQKSGVLKALHSLNVDISLEPLEVGDYVLSKDVVVEFKRMPDFIDSILDGRLLTQLKSLKASVLKPLLVIEGEENLFGIRNIHPNSIYGMLATIAVSYGIPVLFTRNEVDTGNLLFMIARREQIGSTSSFSPHASNKPMSAKEQMEYIVSAIPNVGLSLAKRLLERFNSVEGVVNASVEELCEIEGIGAQKAQMIKDILNTNYKV